MVDTVGAPAKMVHLARTVVPIEAGVVALVTATEDEVGMVVAVEVDQVDMEVIPTAIADHMGEEDLEVVEGEDLEVMEAEVDQVVMEVEVMAAVVEEGAAVVEEEEEGVEEAEEAEVEVEEVDGLKTRKMREAQR